MGVSVLCIGISQRSFKIFREAAPSKHVGVLEKQASDVIDAGYFT